ncbi:MAG TPA: cellulase family glycosylhydrolase [Blastocatellia bacterium]|nr:cellulase family glycosylhydrolase [Blastocatellia bacterium]
MKDFVHKLILILITSAAIILSAHQPIAHCAASESNLSAARAKHLRRGINTSHWFAQVGGKQGYSKQHFDSHTTAEDIALIKAMGFDHIRFSVEPAPMFNTDAPDQLPAEYLGYIDRAIDLILANGLSVVVDIHPSDEFKKRLADNRFVEAFGKFWRAFAHHLSSRDPERVFLEVINEPIVEDPYRWMGIQTKLIAAIREGAPRHTIIATAHRWSGHNEFLFLEPVADKNVIYNFHFYEPHTFTHQGATWGSPYWPYLKQVPYPSSPEAVAAILPTVTNEQARGALIEYGRQRWNAERIDAEIAKVAAWARKHNAAVTCNEFGVYRKFVAPADRTAWIRDVRAALEKYGIGWTMWDYQGGFSVVNKTDGRAAPDAETIAALGLKPSDHR